jgi:hypothetical protein
VRGRRRRFLSRSKRRHGRRWTCVVEASGSCRGVDSAVFKTRKRGQGEAPGRGRKVGGKREEVGSPWAPNRCGDARRRAELRREIPPSWRSLLQEDEREMEEEREGSL